MVRFSDLLGGNTDPEDARPKTVSDPAPPFATPDADDPDPDEDGLDQGERSEPAGEADAVAASPVAEVDSPQAVLDRLTQYATSSRTADQVPAPEVEPTPAPGAAQPADDLSGVGDDLLPRAKGTTRKPSRRGKRRP